MKKTARAILAVIAACILTACDPTVWLFKTYSYGYKYLLEVETPEGVFTAYSVHRFDVVDTTSTPALNYQIHFRGEATIVDIPGEWSIIATLQTGPRFSSIDMIHYLPQIYRVVTGRSPGYENLSKPFNLTVPAKHYPVLAIVKDSGERSSYAELSHDEIADAVGADVSIKSLKLISTDDPPTLRISEFLPWVAPPGPTWFEGARLSGSHRASKLRIE